VLPFDVHAERGAAAAQLSAAGVRASRLRAQVHRHDVLTQVAFPVGALGADDTGPEAGTVVQGCAGHGRVYEGLNVWNRKVAG
jgi:hypothetical protein